SRATSKRCPLRSRSRSIQWSTSRLGTTKVCPGARGSIVRKATHASSDQRKRPGISPAMMRLKMVAIPRILVVDGDLSARTVDHLDVGVEDAGEHVVLHDRGRRTE